MTPVRKYEPSTEPLVVVEPPAIPGETREERLAVCHQLCKDIRKAVGARAGGITVRYKTVGGYGTGNPPQHHRHYPEAEADPTEALEDEE